VLVFPLLENRSPLTLLHPKILSRSEGNAKSTVFGLEWNGTALIMTSNAKPEINAEIFLDSVQIVFLPILAELRRLDEFAKEITVLLMDNCPSHIANDVIALLTEARVRVITFAPHATHNSDLSSPQRDPVWYSQPTAKIRIGFPRRENDHYIYRDVISRLQTNDGGT
jgi:hypothetical protein